MADLLSAAMKAARAGGEVALQYFERAVAWETKPDGTPVTVADRATERMIFRRLHEADPTAGFLGEEGAVWKSPDLVTIPRRWIVDPIDGTREFLGGRASWAVLIAFEEAGVITLGVIHAPALGDTYFAVKGGGSWKNDVRLRVSPVEHFGGPLRLAGPRMTPEPYWHEFITEDGASHQTPKDVFGYTAVAEGRGLAYVEMDKNGSYPWDLAAPKVLVEEAGGCFTDVDGKPSIYGRSGVATNGHTHGHILSALW